MSKKKVFIHGGCSSRDAVDFYDEYGLELAGYVARQSLISAYSPTDGKQFNFSRVKSTFQKRMLNWDVKGSLPTLLRETEFDLLVWDLMIERVGVGKTPSGNYVTRNIDFAAQKSGPKLSQYLNFGTPAHFEAWSEACVRHIELLKGLGALDKVVINATPWASLDDLGAPADKDSFLSATFFNESVEKYHSFAESLGVRVIRMPAEQAVASSSHKWGSAPFHYIPETYQAFLNKVRQEGLV